MEKIIKFFEEIGLPLQHFPETANLSELWQFDGGLNGYLVQLFPGINGRGEVSVFGDISAPNDRGLSLSLPLHSWMTDGPGWVREYLQEYPLP